MKRTKANKKEIFFIENSEFGFLFDEIPHGTSRIIRDRLITKFGKSHAFTLNYINMCLSRNDPRYNQDILNEALAHFAEGYANLEKIKTILSEVVSKRQKSIAS